MSRKITEIELFFEDLFPFPLSEGMFCVGRGTDEYEARAITRGQWERVVEDWPGTVGTIIARCDEDSIRRGVLERLSDGRLADLLPQAPRLLSPAPLLCMALIAVLIAEIASGIVLWSGAINAANLEQREVLEKLRTEVAPLVERRKAIGLMNQQVDIVSKFSDQDSGRMLMTFNRITKELASGTYLDHMELSGQQLSLTGYGKDTSTWLHKLGLKIVNEDVQTLPLTDRFKVTFDLKK
jgi:hypothetical protein